MNKILMNNKPSDSTNAEFEKAWENSSYIMEPLYKTLLIIKNEISSVKNDDFDCPNHYAKLAFRMGQIKIIDQITDMLPKSVTMPGNKL
jgi:hypothetical protein